MPKWQPNSKHSAGPITDQEKTILNDPIGTRFMEARRGVSEDPKFSKYLDDCRKREVAGKENRAAHCARLLAEAEGLKKLTEEVKLYPFLLYEHRDAIAQAFKGWEVEVLGNIRAWAKNDVLWRLNAANDRIGKLRSVCSRVLEKYIVDRAYTSWNISEDQIMEDPLVWPVFFRVLRGKEPFEKIDPAIDDLAERLSSPQVTASV